MKETTIGRARRGIGTFLLCFAVVAASAQEPGHETEDNDDSYNDEVEVEFPFSAKWGLRDGDTLDAVLPEIVLNLLHIDPAGGTNVVMSPDVRVDVEREVREFACEAMSPSWMPRESVGIDLRTNEGIDVARMCWTNEGFRVEIIRTLGMVVTRLVPCTGGAGDDMEDRVLFGSNLCRKVFSPIGQLPGSFDDSFRILALNERIAEYSFWKPRQLSDDVVIGAPKTFEDEGVDWTIEWGDEDSDEGGPKEIKLRVAPTERSPIMWLHWWRNVYWWNDGASVTFFYENVHGLSPFYSCTFDGRWFEIREQEAQR